MSNQPTYRLTYLLVLFFAAANGAKYGRAQDTLAEFRSFKGRTTINADAKAIDAWRDRRFGMFIHWGPSASRNLPHSHARRSRFKPTGTVDATVYDRFYEEFNPTQYDPDAWVDLAQNAGMKYLVFTAKHHDGFAMFDSAASDYDITSTPYKRDVCAMLAEACHNRGLPLGWYYSPRDWYHPSFDSDNHDQYNAFYEEQMLELATNYGPLSILWFDGTGPASTKMWGDTPLRVAAMLRRKHPQVMLNPRGGFPGDFETTEKRVGAFNRDQPWETCATITRAGWIYRDESMEVRSFDELIEQLVYSIGRDGNYLLNIGPRADGTIDPKHAARLLEIGAWLKENGEGVYGTRGGPYTAAPWGAATCKDKSIYLFITDSDIEELRLPPLEARVQGHRMLNGEQASVRQDADGIELTIPRAHHNRGTTVVALDLDRDALDVPVVAGETSLALDKRASASSVFRDNNHKFGPANAIDDDPLSYWEADQSEQECWIEIDLGREEWIGHAMLAQTGSWCPLHDFELLYKKEGQWVSALKCIGRAPGDPPVLSFAPFKARHVRVDITKRASRLNLCDLKLFAPRDR